jgi:hypothetical protein
MLSLSLFDIGLSRDFDRDESIRVRRHFDIDIRVRRHFDIDIRVRRHFDIDISSQEPL